MERRALFYYLSSRIYVKSLKIIIQLSQATALIIAAVDAGKNKEHFESFAVVNHLIEVVDFYKFMKFLKAGKQNRCRLAKGHARSGCFGGAVSGGSS